jgi:hypothetical protein
MTWCAACSDSLGGGPAPSPVIPSFSWLSGESGLDAVFTPLTPDLAGHAYTITSTGGDPDGAFMSECSPMGTLVGPSLASGPEAGTVPAGAGCLLVWEFPPLPPVPPGASTITLTVA